MTFEPKRWIGPLALVLPLVAALAYLLWTSKEAQQVAVESAFLIFTVFTTPFVLETSVAILGLVGVMTYNQWRLSKEGDGWVEMEIKDSPDSEPK